MKNEQGYPSAFDHLLSTNSDLLGLIRFLRSFLNISRKLACTCDINHIIFFSSPTALWKFQYIEIRPLTLFDVRLHNKAHHYTHATSENTGSWTVKLLFTRDYC